MAIRAGSDETFHIADSTQKIILGMLVLKKLADLEFRVAPITLKWHSYLVQSALPIKTH